MNSKTYKTNSNTPNNEKLLVLLVDSPTPRVFNQNAFISFDININKHHIYKCFGNFIWYKSGPINFRPGIELTKFARMTDQEITYQYQRLFSYFVKFNNHNLTFDNAWALFEKAMGKSIGEKEKQKNTEKKEIITPAHYNSFYFHSLINSYFYSLILKQFDLFVFKDDDFQKDDLLFFYVNNEYYLYSIDSPTKDSITNIYIMKTIFLRDKAREYLDSLYPVCVKNEKPYFRYHNTKYGKKDSFKTILIHHINSVMRFEAELITRAGLQIAKCSYCNNYFVPELQKNATICKDVLFVEKRNTISSDGKQIEKPERYRYCTSLANLKEGHDIEFIPGEITRARSRIKNKCVLDNEKERWKEELRKKKYKNHEISTEEMFGFLISDIKEGQRKNALNRYKQEFKRDFPDEYQLPYFFGEKE